MWILMFNPALFQITCSVICLARVELILSWHFSQALHLLTHSQSHFLTKAFVISPHRLVSNCELLVVKDLWIIVVKDLWITCGEGPVNNCGEAIVVCIDCKAFCLVTAASLGVMIITLSLTRQFPCGCVSNWATEGRQVGQWGHPCLRHAWWQGLHQQRHHQPAHVS